MAIDTVTICYDDGVSGSEVCQSSQSLIMPSSLIGGLVSWWELDEASGTRADAHGAYNLASTGVGSTTGYVNTLAADFVASEGDYLSRSATPYAASEGTVAFWCKQNSDTAAQWIFTFNGFAEMDCYRTSVAMTFRVNNDIAPASALITATNWNLLVCTWNATTGSIWANNVKGSDSTGSYTGVSGSGDLVIGERHTGGQNWDGRIGPFMIWDRVLTTSELTELWNSGSGLKYSDL